jgi:N-lysine methyltransferase SETD6
VLTFNQREELERLGFIEDAFVIGNSGSGMKLRDVIPADLRMIITAFCLPAEQFHPSKLSNHLKGSGLAVSEASLLLTSIINRLSDYKSSTQEDTKILEKLKNNERLEIPDGVSPKRYEMAVQVRRGEKEILHKSLQLLQDFVAKQSRRVPGESVKRKRNEGHAVAANKKKVARA